MTFWPYAPTAISEIMKFATDIRSTDQGEFRDSLHDAIQIFTLSFRLKAAEASQLAQSALENIHGAWEMPIWCDITRLSSDVVAGATSITLQTDADYRPGGQAAIMSSNSNWEILEVEAVFDGFITLSAPVVSDFPAGAIVAPIGSFIVPSGFSGALKYGVTDFSSKFIRTDAADLAADSIVEYDGFDVLTETPKSTGGLSTELGRSNDFIDNGFGVFEIEEIEDYTRNKSRVSFIDVSYSARWRRRGFFHRMRGRDRPFFVPTWKKDLPLTAGASAGSSAISVSLQSTDETEIAGRRIQIIDGETVLYRTINFASIGTGVVTLTLDENHGVAISQDAVVSWLRLMRLNSDQINVNHAFTTTGFVSSVSVEVIEVAQ